MKLKRLAVLIHLFFAILLLLAIPFLFTDAGRWGVGYSTAVFIFSINNLRLSRCPYCKKLGLRPNPFSKNAGYCKHCNELVDFC